MPDKRLKGKEFPANSMSSCPDLSARDRVRCLTVNQPPHGFAGSSPASPTNPVKVIGFEESCGPDFRGLFSCIDFEMAHERSNPDCERPVGRHRVRRVEGEGLRCREDISLVGHNDMPLMDVISPPLTTVRSNTGDGTDRRQDARRQDQERGGVRRSTVFRAIEARD